MSQRTIRIGGRAVTIETTDLAENANGAVLVRSGDTVVLATAVAERDEKPLGYVPLRVEYEERFYAAGAILGGRYFRREGKPSEEAVLAARAIDRAIRPLFPKDYRCETQVIVTVLALGDEEPDVLGIIAASAALSLSDIPWEGPLGACRVIETRGERHLFPEREARYGAEVDLLITGKGDGTLNMIECASLEATDDALAECLTLALGELRACTAAQGELAREVGKEKRSVRTRPYPERYESLLRERAALLSAAVFSGKPGWDSIEAEREQFLAALAEEGVDTRRAHEFFDSAVEELLHTEGLAERRPDGRTLSELRPITATAGGLSPRLHGSGIFARGGTKTLSVVTLGSPEDAERFATMESRIGAKRFMHHYNFAPFSAGETGKLGMPSRRELGHGALAEKALVPILPDPASFPYALRVVSESLSSNGSTSMAAVSGSSLALADAGVPITRHAAGIAIGIHYQSPEHYRLIADIQGPEDRFGGMDMKVAGTSVGVTAIQLDTKEPGIALCAIIEGLALAKECRNHILTVLSKALPTPRKELSVYAPRILRIPVPRARRGAVLGQGGSTVLGIEEETGARIELTDEDEAVVSGSKVETDAAVSLLAQVIEGYAKGSIVEGVVTNVVDFGAFVSLSPHQDALIHISELSTKRIKHPSEVLAKGDTVRAVVKSIDAGGRIGLSVKDLPRE